MSKILNIGLVLLFGLALVVMVYPPKINFYAGGDELVDEASTLNLEQAHEREEIIKAANSVDSPLIKFMLEVLVDELVVGRHREEMQKLYRRYGKEF